MTQQLAFPLSRRDDPSTSNRAAARAARSGYPARILEALRQRNLCTKCLCELLAGERPQSWPTISAACSRLYHHDGLTQPTSYECARHRCQVWTLLAIATVRVAGEQL